MSLAHETLFDVHGPPLQVAVCICSQVRPPKPRILASTLIQKRCDHTVIVLLTYP